MNEFVVERDTKASEFGFRKGSMDTVTTVELQQGHIQRAIGALQAVLDGERRAGMEEDTSIIENLRDIISDLNFTALMEYPDSFREWMEGYFDRDTISDIYTHGANAGYGHLTYYHDTAILYDKYEDEIWNAMTEDADAFGHESVMEFIASWNTDPQSDLELKNAMVWYMAERVAREIIEQGEDELGE